MNQKDVKIPYDVWYDLVKYFIFGLQDDEVYASCADGVLKKWKAIYKRDLYSRYKKTSLSPAEREEARQAYLEEAGISSGFIWPEGWEN